MKLFSFILSVIVFFVALYFFMIKVSEVESVNDVIYVLLLVTLKAVCVVGVIINWEIVRGKKNDSVVLFINNSYSKKKKRIK